MTTPQAMLMTQCPVKWAKLILMKKMTITKMKNNKIKTLSQVIIKMNMTQNKNTQKILKIRPINPWTSLQWNSPPLSIKNHLLHSGKNIKLTWLSISIISALKKTYNHNLNSNKINPNSTYLNSNFLKLNKSKTLSSKKSIMIKKRKNKAQILPSSNKDTKN